MKRKVVVILSILMLAVSSVFAQTFTTEMKTVFTDENSSARLQHVKSAIDSKGNLHIVFTGFNNKAYYGTNQSGAWKFSNLSYMDEDYNETSDVAYFPNIAIEKTDIIHITMFGRYKEKFYYAKKTPAAGEFKFSSVKFSPEPVRFLVYGEYCDMAIDKNGGLHLICRADYTNQKEFKYYESAIYFNKPANSDKWNLQVLLYDTKWDERNWRYGTNSSIACFGDKVYAAIGGDNELNLGTRNISGGTWKIDKLIQTSDKFINSAKDMLSLAVSPNGSLRFAFFDRTGDEKSPWHGLTIFSQSACGNNGWTGYNGFKESKSKNNPAVAFDKNGKFYFAMGRNGFALWHQACDCDGEYKKIYGDGNNQGDFVDMLIDKQNTVYAFYTSVYDNKLHLLTAKPNSDTKDCNYPPVITKYTGKTNVKPDEEWTGTITASDPECNKIDFYTIIKNENFTINDHGNGTATVKAKFPKGNGTGDPGITIWVRDSKHKDVNNKLSAITFKLRLTPEGKEKGNIKVENKCTGSNKGKPINGNTENNEVNENQSNGNNETGDVNTGTEINSDCEKFIKRYEKFADEYGPIVKKVKANPTDMEALNKLSALMEEFGSYSKEWENLYECNKIPGYQKRYDAATKKIQDANK